MTKQEEKALRRLVVAARGTDKIEFESALITTEILLGIRRDVP